MLRNLNRTLFVLGTNLNYVFMKTYIIAACTLLTMGTFACTQSSVELNPVSATGGARGGSPTPTPPASTTLPALPANPNPVYDLRPILPAGTWTVKSYYRSGSDATSDFAGCTFVFASNGQVTATDSKGKSSSGLWVATVGGVTYYGSAPTVTALSLYFDKKTPKPFDRLSNTWNVNLATTSTDVIIDNVEPQAGERVEFKL